jgi:hypothetical protein
MRTFVPALLAMTLLTAAQAGSVAPNPNEAQYVYGTVKTIPSNTVGSLDLTDPSELQFQYGDLKYRLPYRQIKSFQLSGAKAPQHTIAHLPVKLPAFHSHEQMLDVSFFEKEGSVGTVSFRLTGKNLKTAEWILAERVRVEKEAAQNPGRAKLAEPWWGDKYWKTPRNRPGWPDATAEPVGTKE